MSGDKTHPESHETKFDCAVINLWINPFFVQKSIICCKLFINPRDGQLPLPLLSPRPDIEHYSKLKSVQNWCPFPLLLQAKKYPNMLTVHAQINRNQS